MTNETVRKLVGSRNDLVLQRDRLRGRHRSLDLELQKISIGRQGNDRTWLDGYYKDQDDPPVIEMDKFVDNAKKLGEYCSDHPDIGLITAADKLFSDSN